MSNTPPKIALSLGLAALVAWGTGCARPNQAYACDPEGDPDQCDLGWTCSPSRFCEPLKSEGDPPSTSTGDCALGTCVGFCDDVDVCHPGRTELSTSPPAPETGWGASMAIDRHGTIYVAHRDRVGGLYFTSWDRTSGFAHETVPTGGAVVSHHSLALSLDGIPVIAFHDAVAGSVELATRPDSSPWAVAPVESFSSDGSIGVGHPSTRTMSGGVGILYSWGVPYADNENVLAGGLRFAIGAPGSFVIEEVGSPTDAPFETYDRVASLGHFGPDEPVLGCVLAPLNLNLSRSIDIVLRASDGSWSFHPIASSFQTTGTVRLALTTDGRDTIHLIYSRPSGGSGETLLYWSGTGADLRSGGEIALPEEVVPQLRLGVNMDLALDSMGQPVAAYQAEQGGVWRTIVKMRSGISGWREIILDESTMPVHGVSITIDAEDEIWVAYDTDGTLALSHLKR